MKRIVKIYKTESYSTYIVRQPITIDLGDYPELEGMTNEEIVDYLDSNSCDMKSKNENYYSLSDQIMDQDTLKDKIYDAEESHIVED